MRDVTDPYRRQTRNLGAGAETTEEYHEIQRLQGIRERRKLEEERFGVPPKPSREPAPSGPYSVIGGYFGRTTYYPGLGGWESEPATWWKAEDYSFENGYRPGSHTRETA